jgi:hypothetical protein
MRELKAATQHSIRITDSITGETAELFYRMPTASERVGFERAAHQWKKNRFMDKSGEARLEYGMKVLTGFKDGAFAVDGKPISSDPSTPDYYPDWKTLVQESASDLVNAMAMAVFQGARVEEAEDEGEEDDGTSPFGGGSGE